MNDLLLPKCPKCNNNLGIVRYFDPIINEWGYIVQCSNKCNDTRIVDDNRDMAISKFVATVNYLEKINAPS